MRDMKPCPFCDGAGRVNKSRFLRSDSPVSDGIEVEVEHHAPKAWYQGEQETNMLKEHAVFVDPISVARRLSPGRYVMFKREEG